MVSRIIKKQEFPTVDAGILRAVSLPRGWEEGLGRVFVDNSPGEISIPSFMTHANASILEGIRGEVVYLIIRM